MDEINDLGRVLNYFTCGGAFVNVPLLIKSCRHCFFLKRTKKNVVFFVKIALDEEQVGRVLGDREENSYVQ